MFGINHNKTFEKLTERCLWLSPSYLVVGWGVGGEGGVQILFFPSFIQSDQFIKNPPIY